MSYIQNNKNESLTQFRRRHNQVLCTDILTSKPMKLKYFHMSLLCRYVPSACALASSYQWKQWMEFLNLHYGVYFAWKNLYIPVSLREKIYSNKFSILVYTWLPPYHGELLSFPMTPELCWQERELLVEPTIPDRSKCKGQTKCNFWSSKLGVGCGAKDPKPENKNCCYWTMEEAKTHT